MLSKKDLNDLYQIFVIIEQNAAAGLNIQDALNLYAQNCRPKIKKILASIQHDLSNGIQLPNAFAKHPGFFPDYIVEMMRLNEGSGQSAKIYAEIVRTLDQEIDLRRNLGSQLSQGIFMLVLLIITIGIVLFVVLPSIGSMMSSLDMQLPFFTKLLIDIGIMSKTYWWAFLILFATGIISSIIYFKSHPATLARLQLHIPLYWPLKFYLIQYRFALIFGICREAGLETVTALGYTATGSDNILVKQLIERALRDLSRAGSGLTKALKKQDTDKIIDESFWLFLQAGEKSDMAALMRTRADFYRRQLIVEAKMFNNNLSNMIMTPFFAILALIVFAVISPLFSMMSQLASGAGGM